MWLPDTPQDKDNRLYDCGFSDGKEESAERIAELEAALIYALAPDGVHTDMPGGVMIRQRFAAQEWDLVRRELPANGVEYTLKRKE